MVAKRSCSGFFFLRRCFVRHRLTIVCWIARFGVGFQMWDFGVRARRMFGLTFVHSSYNRSSAANRLKKYERKKNTTILRTQWQKVISTSTGSFTSFVFEITCVCMFVYLYYARCAAPFNGVFVFIFIFYSTLCAHTVVVAVSMFEFQIHAASLSATCFLCVFVCARAFASMNGKLNEAIEKYFFGFDFLCWSMHHRVLSTRT